MSRPQSGDKRSAIVQAAVDLVAEEGAAATTAAIAKRAAVSHGTVFHYFENKAELLNIVYLELKTEIHQATISTLQDSADPVEQLHHLWVKWIGWGASNPVRRHALARLTNEQIITAATREHSAASSDFGFKIVQAAVAKGIFKDQPFHLVGRIFEALADVAMESMIAEPERAEQYSNVIFQALTKALQ